jgi:RNA polymerase primary sigma factor
MQGAVTEAAVKKYCDAMNLSSHPVSLDNPVSDEDGRSFVDFLQDLSAENPVEDIEQVQQIERARSAMGDLKPIERDILRRRFLQEDPDTLKIIGQEYNLSRERIRQLEAQGLHKLRRALGVELS